MKKVLFVVLILLMLIPFNSLDAKALPLPGCDRIEPSKRVECFPDLTFTGVNTAGSIVFWDNSGKTGGGWILIRKVGTKYPFPHNGDQYYIILMTDGTIRITQ